MDLKTAFSRAERGLRDDFRLYLIAVVSLTIAFMCLGATLLGLDNVASLAERWGSSSRITVYLAEGARSEDVRGLELRLQKLPEVSKVEHVTSLEAHAQFLEMSGLSGELSSLPAEAFPSSLEITLRSGISGERVELIGEKLAAFAAVGSVDTYRAFFDELDSLVMTGRGVSVAIGLLVLACVLAVIGSTIRLAVAGRRQEIEVMKLCGATDSFVRRPFLVEGACQGFMAALSAVVFLLLSFMVIRSHIDETFLVLSGTHLSFLGPLEMLGMLIAGGAAGAAGSALSLRRYLTV